MLEQLTICNTSPLLYLHLVKYLDLLPKLGIILKAKQRGFLETVEPVIFALRNVGLWLGDRLVAEALQQAGE